MRFVLPPVLATGVIAFLAACGGGGNSNPPPANAPAAPAVPVPTAPATVVAVPSTPATTAPSTQQVVTMALPTTSIGVENDPTFGAVAGYTQQQYSQVLGFAPGSQIMVRNGDQTVHTLSTVGTSGFVQTSLPVNAAGGNTIGVGFSSGTTTPGQLVGPYTLAAGTYYMGCAFHYLSNSMRTVLVVAANAQPGPQATPGPGPTPTTNPGGGNGY